MEDNNKKREELRSTLRAKIQANSIKRMNNRSKQHIVENLEKELKDKFGADVDINELMKKTFNNNK